jgi:hypothetical protein
MANDLAVFFRFALSLSTDQRNIAIVETEFEASGSHFAVPCTHGVFDGGLLPAREFRDSKRSF